MTERVRFRLNHGARRPVHAAVDKAPEGYIVEIRPETRRDQQNRLLWPLLEDISQQVKWANRDLLPDDWKNGFMMALARADYVPGIVPGTIWPLGLSTSSLSVAKFSELIDLIYAFGAENGVKFRTDRNAFDSAQAESALVAGAGRVATGAQGLDNEVRKPSPGGEDAG